jgi:hypothetical protein
MNDKPICDGPLLFSPRRGDHGARARFMITSEHLTCPILRSSASPGQRGPMSRVRCPSAGAFFCLLFFLPPCRADSLRSVLPHSFAVQAAMIASSGGLGYLFRVAATDLASARWAPAQSFGGHAVHVCADDER